MDSLQSALKKLKFHEASKEFGGYLLPREIVALVDKHPFLEPLQRVQVAQQYKQKGKSIGCWFYIPAVFAKKLGLVHRNDKG